jgi:hypothetical protein
VERNRAIGTGATLLPGQRRTLPSLDRRGEIGRHSGKPRLQSVRAGWRHIAGSSPAVDLKERRRLHLNETKIAAGESKITPEHPATHDPLLRNAMMPTSARSSWLDDIAYYDDDTVGTKYRILTYGEMGSGKTHFLGTWPGLFVLDYDAGGLTLRKQRIHGRSIPILASRGVVRKTFDILDAAIAERPPFDDPSIETIGLDTITDFSNMAVEDFLLQANKDPLFTKASYDEYGKLKTNCIELGRRLKRLSVKYNIVVSAKVKLEKDEALGMFVGNPNLVGAYADLIGGDFDEVYFLADESKKDVPKYAAYTGHYLFYSAKSRLGLPYRIENPTYAKLVELSKK